MILENNLWLNLVFSLITGLNQIMGYRRFPNACIKFIVFARSPPRSETSQDRGLVDLYLFEAHESRALTSRRGKETEE